MLSNHYYHHHHSRRQESINLRSFSLLFQLIDSFAVNMNPDFQRYQQCEGSHTPSRNDINKYLKFHDKLPTAPCDDNAKVFSDHSYNTLINNVDTITANYDAEIDFFKDNVDLGIDISLSGINDMAVGDLHISTTDAQKNYYNPAVVATNSHCDTGSVGNKHIRETGLGVGKKILSMKRKLEEENDDDISDDENSDDDDRSDTNIDEGIVEDDKPLKSAVIKSKPRGRYKKMTIANVVRPVHSGKPTPVDPATDTLFRNILMHQPSDLSSINNNRMFASHLLDTGYYMFIVVKPSSENNTDDMYTIRYVNCVHSVYNEYTAHHSHHDRLVLVVTYERYRFLISYQLLLDLEIDIPQQDQFDDKKLHTKNQKNQCFFEEVKDFEFLTRLTNFFHLDQVFVQGKISLLMASIGENKARFVHHTLGEMINNKSLFTLPFHMCKKEASAEELAKYDQSMYVEDIMKLTRGLTFVTLPENKKKNINRLQIIEKVVNSLSFWLRSKDVRSSDMKEKSYFTYKFGSVVRLLYNQSDKGVNKLFKIKKENGSARLIENYLNACKKEPNAHNFILITTKADERITIIKMGVEFIWITSVMKDIIVSDLIKKYRLYNHHIFNLNSVNRKEINNRHNGLVKLMAFYTGKCLTMDEVKTIAINNFECNYELRVHHIDNKNVLPGNSTTFSV
jgi:Trans-activating transcriptional regulator